MPKVTKSKSSKRYIVATYEPTGHWERIYRDPEIRKRFANVGKPRKTILPPPIDPPVNRRHLIERMGLELQALEHVDELALLARLTKQLLLEY